MDCKCVESFILLFKLTHLEQDIAQRALSDDVESQKKRYSEMKRKLQKVDQNHRESGTKLPRKSLHNVTLDEPLSLVDNTSNSDTMFLANRMDVQSTLKARMSPDSVFSSLMNELTEKDVSQASSIFDSEKVLSAGPELSGSNVVSTSSKETREYTGDLPEESALCHTLPKLLSDLSLTRSEESDADYPYQIRILPLDRVQNVTICFQHWKDVMFVLHQSSFVGCDWCWKGLQKFFEKFDLQPNLLSSTEAGLLAASWIESEHDQCATESIGSKDIVIVHHFCSVGTTNTAGNMASSKPYFDHLTNAVDNLRNAWIIVKVQV
jgi:hypothetical protein